MTTFVAAIAALIFAATLTLSQPTPTVVTTSAGSPAVLWRPVRSAPSISPAAPSLGVEPRTAVPSLAAAIDAVSLPDGIVDYIESLPPPPIVRWENGYLASGAPDKFVDEFVQPGGIIDCESGRPDRADWVTVVSPTRDVGPAQINMAAHADTIESRWPDLDALASMQDPWRNGFFAGVLVLGRGDLGDWYMSRHCHGHR